MAVAVAVYERASACNHSCAPNAACRFAGRELSLVVSSTVPRGAEVCVSYGPTSFREPDAATRRHALQEKYHFLCACAVCSAAPVSRDEGAPGAALPWEIRVVAAHAHDDAARALAGAGKWAAAADRVDAAIALLAKGAVADGDAAPQELGKEWLKLAGLRYNAGQMGAAAAAAGKARASLAITLPPGHDTLVEVERLLAAATQAAAAAAGGQA